MGSSTQQVVVFANIRALGGRVEELLTEFAPVVALNRTEPGCIVFDVHRSHDDPDLLLMHEVWETQADLDRHIARPHVQVFLDAMTERGFGEQLPLFPSSRVL